MAAEPDDRRLRAGRARAAPDRQRLRPVLAADEEAVRRLYELKGRAEAQPTALLAASVDALLELVPELRGGLERRSQALLPGPYTLVLPNPARRFRGSPARARAIGVRVAGAARPARRVLDAVACVAATSANDPGGPAAATLDEVPSGSAPAAAPSSTPGACRARLDRRST